MEAIRRRSPVWMGPALLAALLINAGLFSLVTLLSQERRGAQDISDPSGVNLVSLETPEPPALEQVEEPKKPETETKPDFAPDLAPPPLDLGAAGLDLGIAIDLGDLGAGGLEEEIVFNSYELDQPPQATVRMPPVYPYKAREQGLEGAVQVKLLINVDGSVGQLIILDARPKGIFEDAVRKTVPKWRFSPGRIAGEEVTSWAITTVRFTLD